MYSIITNHWVSTVIVYAWVQYMVLITFFCVDLFALSLGWSFSGQFQLISSLLLNILLIIFFASLLAPLISLWDYHNWYPNYVSTLSLVSQDLDVQFHLSTICSSCWECDLFWNTLFSNKTNHFTCCIQMKSNYFVPEKRMIQQNELGWTMCCIWRVCISKLEMSGHRE